MMPSRADNASGSLPMCRSRTRDLFRGRCRRRRRVCRCGHVFRGRGGRLRRIRERRADNLVLVRAWLILLGDDPVRLGFVRRRVGRGRAPVQGSVQCRPVAGRGAARVTRHPARVGGSGRIRRHRLNRGGDRAANNALDIVVLGRLRHNPRTRQSTQRRITEGLSKPEIIRCLRRYVAREMFTALTTHDTDDQPSAPPTMSTAA